MTYETSDAYKALWDTILPLGPYCLMADKTVVMAKDVHHWLDNMQTSRRIAENEFDGEAIYVSTVFLGIDHRHGATGGEPLLFETMIFDTEKREEIDGYQQRCSTYEEALQQHADACALVRRTLLKAAGT